MCGTTILGTARQLDQPVPSWGGTCWPSRGVFRVHFALALHTANDVFCHLLLVGGAYEAWLYGSDDGCSHLLLVREQAPHMQPHPETKEDTFLERRKPRSSLANRS